MSELIEYKVRPVTRYSITRFERGANDTGSSRVLGEHDIYDTAYQVAYALCRADHERLGYPFTDERIQYPRHQDMDAVGVAG